jgi:uncharacterized membrane protein HdeD (DUF308 family)
MSENIQTVGSTFLEEIKKNSGLAIAMGIIVLIAGILAIGSPFAAGISVAMIVGVLLVIGGIGHLIFAIRGSTGIWNVLFSVLTVIVGGYMLANLGVALASLTLFLAAYFIVSGIFEILFAFRVKPVNGWGWALFSGIVSVILGLMIWGQFPLSGAWAVGILFGIRMVFIGWTLIIIGSGARKLTREIAVG